MALFSDPGFWVGVSFVLFILLIMYFKVPGQMTKALDDRADRIRQELDDAQKLREEAQALLAEYQRKRTEAEKEAEDIVTQAKAEAEAYAEETRRKLAESVERRTALAEQKIAQAEANAMNEVRAAATDLAVAAAERIIAAEVQGKKADDMIDASIAAVKTRLN
ncbi:MAG: F0F1 ATP synthase subunit B [Pseudomonadota bacterium]